MSGDRFLIPDAAGGPLSHDIADYPGGIVLPIDKPYRWTSADVIRKVKYAAIRHFGKKNLKVGHAGTLDPLATGVLLVCIGDACKRAQEFQDHDKEYEAVVRFGATTPSYDLEKEVDRTFPFDQVTEAAVRGVLPTFLGTQEQVAPLFSAKSVDGVRAYEMARKLYKSYHSADIPSGSLPDFDAAALATLHHSTITISAIDLLSFSHSNPTHFPEGNGPSGAFARIGSRSDAEEGPFPSGTNAAELSNASSRIHLADTSALGLPEARIRIACSKGTYIRALARDLGEALGTGAHLSGLVRTRTGDFSLADALTLDQVLSLLCS